MDPNEMMEMQGNPADLAMALQQAMQGQPKPEPSLWERLKALLTSSGTEWADNANQMLPEQVSGRQGVEATRAKAALLEQIAKGGM